jgi:hypothetical protein
MGLLWLFIPIAALAQAVTGVGFAAIEVHDPVNGGNMPGYVFYPSATANGVSWRGPYALDATENAPPIPVDEVLLPRFNVLHIAPHIKTLAGIRMIPDAGHYVFLAPCSRELARGNADICEDPPGVDRVAVHRQINAAALAYYRKTLGIK